jgi:hypothetical protein
MTFVLLDLMRLDCPEVNEALATGKLSGDGRLMEIPEPTASALRRCGLITQAPVISPPSEPKWVGVVKKLATPEDLGVGDTIARVIGPVGGDAFKLWFEKLFGCSCGCPERQEELNRRFPYVDSLRPVNGAVRSLH